MHWISSIADILLNLQDNSNKDMGKKRGDTPPKNSIYRFVDKKQTITIDIKNLIYKKIKKNTMLYKINILIHYFYKTLYYNIL